MQGTQEQTKDDSNRVFRRSGGGLVSMPGLRDESCFSGKKILVHSLAASLEEYVNH
jgi:hypothetical protein